MIIQLHDFNTGVRVPHVVPDGPIEEFMRFILETRTWRDYPDRAVEKLLRLRKTLLAAAQPLPPVIEPGPEMATVAAAPIEPTPVKPRKGR